MKILVLSNMLPYPPDMGEKVRNYNLLKRIGSRHELTVLAHTRPDRIEQDQNRLGKVAEFCKEVKLGLLEDPAGKWDWRKQRLHAILSGRPIYPIGFFSRETAQQLKDLLAINTYDVIQMEHSYLAPYVEVIPSDYPALKVLTFIDVVAERFKTLYKNERIGRNKLFYYLDWRLFERWEASFARNFHLGVTMSEVDRSMLLGKRSDLNLAVAPNGVDLQQYNFIAEEADEPNILFTGKMDYEPNKHAAVYLIEEIFPLIKSVIPRARLYVVGGNPDDQIQALGKRPDVEVTGYVDSLIPYYRKSFVSVVPLKSGSGTRLKILESMALGRPLVSTSIGCEGIDVEDGRHVEIADDTQSFARCVIRLWQDRERRTELTHHARRLVEEKYGWDAITHNLLSLYKDQLEQVRMNQGARQLP